MKLKERILSTHQPRGGKMSLMKRMNMRKMWKKKQLCQMKKSRNQNGGENLGVPVPAKGARRSTRMMILLQENNRQFIVGRQSFLTVMTNDEKKKVANTNICLRIVV
uniref:Uncharacterized protein n=1 Tax=Oryza rufipogon TaxID=4529 RepID=A0A0E0RJ66_ORYRU